MNPLHGLLTCETGALEFHVILQHSITHMSIVYICTTLVHVIHSGISGQCSHTI